MITLMPPQGDAPFRQIKLHSGVTYFPDFENGGEVNVNDEDDAAELELEGWKRDAVSAKAARFTANLLRKAADTQARRLGDAHPRTVVGEVETTAGRVHVEHDAGADIVSLHGINIAMGDIAPDLRAALRSATADFSAAETSEEQTTARMLVGLVVNAIMVRHDRFIGAVVREKVFSLRHDV